MNNARLSGESNGNPASLSFFDPRFHDTDWMECQVRLDLDHQGNNVALSMIQAYREDTVTFFEKLSALPDTWSGGANWYSEDGRVSIDPQGLGNGLVALRVELRDMADLEPLAQELLLVEFDSLRHFTASLGTFLRIPPTPPGWKVPKVSPLGRWSFTDPSSSPRS